jgi:Protein of unknown function (DUF3685)
MRKVRVRRTGELNALSGWRSHLCTAMEMADVVAPLAAAILDRVSRTVSWLLVSLIGRGLGLVYRGIRESMSSHSKSTRRRSEEQQPRPPPPDSDDGLFYGFS